MAAQPRQLQDLGDQQPFQFRDFKGMNATDARTAIDDTEFSWLENFIPIGKGQVTIVPGPGAPVATVADTVTLWGFTLSGTAFSYAVKSTGGVVQVNLATGAQTTVAGSGVLSPSTRLTVWKDTNILFIDPTKGYFQWDGSTLTTIDAARLGIAIEVFEGRVWIVGAGANKRQITFTAPNTFSDFTPANGSGSTTLSDKAFPGQIYQLLSAVEQLWIVGAAAVDAITNVTTVAGVTSFSLTNIVTNVGSIFPSSVISFFRTFLFLTPYGIYAIVGATPQKLSDKLDGLFPLLSLGTDQPAAVGTLFDVFVAATLVNSMDAVGGTGTSRPLLLCFTQGKWFLATQGSALKWITSVVVNGSPQMWGTDGSAIYQLFKDPATAVPYHLRTKLWDFGAWHQIKELLRVGAEFQATGPIGPTLTVENEVVAPVSFTPFLSNQFSWTGSGGAPFTWTGPLGATFTWVLPGLFSQKRSTSLLGHYFGLRLTGTEVSWALTGLALLVKPGSTWD